MERGNWLWNYQFVDGIGTILSQMDRRTKNTSKMGESVQELEQFYKEFEQEFTLFFKELREFVAEKIKTL